MAFLDSICHIVVDDDSWSDLLRGLRDVTEKRFTDLICCAGLAFSADACDAMRCHQNTKLFRSFYFLPFNLLPRDYSLIAKDDGGEQMAKAANHP